VAAGPEAVPAGTDIVEPVAAGAGSGVGSGAGGVRTLLAGAGGATVAKVESGVDTTFSADTGAGIDEVGAVLASVLTVVAGGAVPVGAAGVSAEVVAVAADVMSAGRPAGCGVAPGSASAPGRSSASATPEEPRATASETTQATSGRWPTDRPNIERPYDVRFCMRLRRDITTHAQGRRYAFATIVIAILAKKI
jgi:hypothetical protein